ncbi:MAG: YbjN domain-containing protein [Bacteroidota bacterium]
MENAQNPASTDIFEAQYLKVVEMINCYAESVGLDRNQVFNTEKQVWLWRKGSVQIETVIQRLKFENGSRRDFLRVFSPIMDIPTTSNLLAFYLRLLQLNDIKLGIKFSIVPNSPKVWASYERDIEGIDFKELTTFISDFEYWADTLDDELKAAFPNLN